jgi:hypothetical protein
MHCHFPAICLTVMAMGSLPLQQSATHHGSKSKFLKPQNKIVLYCGEIMHFDTLGGFVSAQSFDSFGTVF